MSLYLTVDLSVYLSIHMFWLHSFGYTHLKKIIDINPFMPSPHNNIETPDADLSIFDMAELTFGTSCRASGWLGGDVRNVMSA